MGSTGLRGISLIENTMKAGTYYIGDLCYVMHGPRWDEFCSITIKKNDCLDGKFKFADGVEFATHGTCYGDGEYIDEEGKKYPVDAGLIGCVRLEDILEEDLPNVRNGNLFEFKHDFVTSSIDGIISFGNVRIDTAVDYSEDEEEVEDIY